MQSAEIFQRQRIIQFCEENRIQIPNFGSTSDLLHTINHSLSILDGTSTSISNSISNQNSLKNHINELESEVDLKLLEINDLEMKLKDAMDSEKLIEALEVISKIESKIIKTQDSKRLKI